MRNACNAPSPPRAARNLTPPLFTFGNQEFREQSPKIGPRGRTTAAALAFLTPLIVVDGHADTLGGVIPIQKGPVAASMIPLGETVSHIALRK